MLSSIYGQTTQSAGITYLGQMSGFGFNILSVQCPMEMSMANIARSFNGIQDLNEKKLSNSEN